MSVRLDLSQLVPDDERDTVLMPDGKEFMIPLLGVKQMSKLLLLEEGMEKKDTFAELGESTDKIVTLLREANPKRKVPDYDLNVTQIMELIAVFCGADSVAEVVRDALAGDGRDVPVSEEDAMQAARDLAESAGVRDEGEEAPLGSVKRSPKRSSRSGTSGRGGRSGGKTKSRGASSKRTSTTRS